MSQAWTDTIEKYREFVAAHPRGIADPDKDGLEEERRDTLKNRWLIEQIGLIVNMEKDYMSSPKLGPFASKVWSRIEHVRAERTTIQNRLYAIRDELEDAEDRYKTAKGAAKRKVTAEAKAIQAEKERLAKRDLDLRAYQSLLVDWDLGLAVAKDAGIPAFDKKWSRHEEHDFKFTVRALGWAPSGYEVRDEENRVVARSRSKVGAHRATRRSRFAGSRVSNRVRPVETRVLVNIEKTPFKPGWDVSRVADVREPSGHVLWSRVVGHAPEGIVQAKRMAHLEAVRLGGSGLANVTIEGVPASQYIWNKYR